MRYSVRTLLLLIGAAFAPISGNAFLLQQPSRASAATTTTTPTTMMRMSKSSRRSHQPLDDELEDLEKARANFEFLMQTEGLVKDDAILPLPHNKDEYTPRPITESSRHRRQLEMDLLATLADSDEAIEELMILWMVERGSEPAEALQRMETVCSPGLVQEERILRDLMDEFGIHWAEPVSRLAALNYYKGNTAESQQWCEVALAVKPWHFEVVHTQVLNALRKGDLAGAIRWQRKALPALSPARNNKARRAWVQRALKDARESMAKAEDAALEKRRASTSNSFRENEVWQ